MLHSSATDIIDSMPIDPDWTIGELLSWIADDDSRCHHQTLLPLLSRLEAALAGDPDAALAPGVAPARSSGQRPTASTVVLVRALVARVRWAPALRDTRLGDLTDIAAPDVSPADPREARDEPTPTDGTAASAPPAELQPV
jgi:hypothetical protein